MATQFVTDHTPCLEIVLEGSPKGGWWGRRIGWQSSAPNTMDIDRRAKLGA